ncbi:MAG: hypothetical protein ABR616_09960 [Dermatophilaceae bacterium]
MSDETTTSAVREAASLIEASEEILAIAVVPLDAADWIGQISTAAKALRPGHLDDALEHVHRRAFRVEENRRHGWLVSEPGEVDPAAPPYIPSDATVLAQTAEALRLTGEILGPDLLPAIEGWSWWDALVDARLALGWDPLDPDWREQKHDADPEPSFHGMPGDPPGPENAERIEQARRRVDLAIGGDDA